MATAKKLQFLTKSKYDGAWDNSLKCMHGFGCYKYPDGSLYHGYFTVGKFHGFGSLKLSAPYGYNLYNFTIRGYFDNGKLVEIESMSFEDGLRVKGKPKDGEMDFSEWAYCNKEDRRFPPEITNGLRAVGPKSKITKNIIDRELNVGQFDTEQGIYNLNTGFITDRLPPYKKASFVPCPREKHWIKRNCREGYAPNERREPVKEDCQKIIKSHIENQIETDLKFGKTCTFHQKPGHKYFAKLYAMEMAEAKKVMDKAFGAGGGIKREYTKNFDLSSPFDAERSESRSSFPVGHLKDPVLERVVCEDNDKFNTSKLSLSMDMSALNINQNLFN